MKKDKILKSSLSTLLKRFSKTDVISSLSNERNVASIKLIPMESLRDNSILKRARINENLLEKRKQSLIEHPNTYTLVVHKKNDYYEVLYPRLDLIAGLKLKLPSMPCYVVDYSEEEIPLYLASVLLQNKDSNIVEMSLLFNTIKSKLKYSQKEIAQAMNLSRSQVTNIMRLIDMPKEILNDVIEGKMSFGHVRAISTLNEEEMRDVVEQIYAKNLSVHDVELLVYSMKHQDHTFDKTKEIEKMYGCTVKGSPNKISISFKNKDDKDKFINELLK